MRLAIHAALLAAAGCLTACGTLSGGAPAVQDGWRPDRGAVQDTTASAPPLPPAATSAPPVELSLQGQMSIKLGPMGKHAAQGLSLGFFFTGTTQAGQLDLMTLMGSQIARVEWQANEAWFTDDKGRHRYDNLDELSIDAIGEAIPLQTLVHWMQGRPDPRQPSRTGRIEGTFEQRGWTIDTRTMDEKKLVAERPGNALQRGVTIKVYLDR